MYKLVQLTSTENLNKLSNLEIFLQRAETYRRALADAKENSILF